MSVQPGFQALDARRQTIDAIRENSARLATVYQTFVSSGIGDVQPPDAIQFGTTFVDLPSVGYGNTVETLLVADRYPRATGGVTKWMRDSKGLYVGAWIYLAVDVPTGPAPIGGGVAPVPIYSITHHFTFTGVAMKNIPANLLGGI